MIWRITDVCSILMIHYVILVQCRFFSIFSGDETFNDVFKDFSHMASENPEKLKRKENQDQ